jgi:hypothetical protein
MRSAESIARWKNSKTLTPNDNNRSKDQVVPFMAWPLVFRLGFPWKVGPLSLELSRCRDETQMNKPRSKPRRRLLLIGLALVAAFWAALVFSEREERRFNAEMERLVHLRVWDPQTMTRAETMAVQEAGLRRLGPRAGRRLLAAVYDEPSKLSGLWQRFGKSAYGWLSRPPPPARLQPPKIDTPDLLWRQGEIASALAAIGKDGRLSTRHLLHLASQSDIGTREAALELLGANGDSSPAVIAALAQSTNGPMPIRVAAAIALHRLQPTNSAALADANYWLAFPDGTFRSVETLRRMGAAAKPFVPGLRRALAKFQADLSDSPYQRARVGGTHAVAVALWHIEGDPEGALLWLEHARRLRAAVQPWLHSNIDAELVDLARDLAESPEFCRAVRPVLEEIKPRPSPALADAFRRIDNTLGNVVNAATGKRENPKDQ